MAELDDILAKANAEANEVFGKLAKSLKQAAEREGTLDLLEVTRAAGLEIDERELARLEIDRIIYIHPWLPWHIWFPWRPLWCWWWHRRFSWYRCCPWWWHRCHWYPHH